MEIWNIKIDYLRERLRWWIVIITFFFTLIVSKLMVLFVQNDSVAAKESLKKIIKADLVPEFGVWNKCCYWFVGCRKNLKFWLQLENHFNSEFESQDYKRTNKNCIFKENHNLDLFLIKTQMWWVCFREVSREILTKFGPNTSLIVLNKLCMQFFNKTFRKKN